MSLKSIRPAQLWKKLTPAAIIDDMHEFKVSVMPKGDLDFSIPLEYYQPTIDRIPFFVLGKFLWHIVDKFKILKYGGMTDEFLQKEVQANPNVDKYFELMHPDDVPLTMTYLKLVHDFYLSIPLNEKKNFHPNFYFRLKRPDSNDYRIVLLQFIEMLCNEDGDVVSMLQLLTDISHIDFANFSPMLTLLDEKNEVLYFSKPNTNEQNELCSAKVVHLTRREKEIIRLLAKGFGSKQISAQLNIAKNTVENHRQHILRKISCNSSAEVVAYAARYGFL